VSASLHLTKHLSKRVATKPNKTKQHQHQYQRTRRVVKQLGHVLLHRRRLGGAEQRQELVVGDKVEPRERGALGLQVVGERALARVEAVGERAQLVEAVLVGWLVMIVG
jgi:hypothetical protein